MDYSKKQQKREEVAKGDYTRRRTTSTPRQTYHSPPNTPEIKKSKTTPSNARKSNRKKKVPVQTQSTNTRPPKSPPSKQYRNTRSNGLGKTSNHPMSPPKKRKKKAPIIPLLLLLLLILGGIAFFYLSVTRNLYPDLSGNLKKFGISQEAAAVAKEHKIVNVAIFGVDAREGLDGSRSDSIMIASADFENGGIHITSLMRDTLVFSEEENDFDKLNASYAYYGPEGALRTINQNFDTALTDYVVVDFSCVMTIVDKVGGVTVNVESQEELDAINFWIQDLNATLGINIKNLVGLGEQELNGGQALTYARIRSIGNGDFDRTQRQRVIVEAVVKKAMALSPWDQYQLIQSVLPYIDTSLSPTETIKYAFNTLLMPDKSISQNRLPTDNLVDTGFLGDVSYVFPITLEDNIREFYAQVYGIDYTPSTTAQNISTKIDQLW